MSWYGPVWQEYYWDDVGAMENRIVQRWHCTDAVEFIEAVLDWLTCKIYSSLERIGKEGNCLMIFFLFLHCWMAVSSQQRKKGEKTRKEHKESCAWRLNMALYHSLWAGKARRMSIPFIIGFHSSPSTGWTVQHTSLFMHQRPPAKWNGINSLFCKAFWDLPV